jgi:hypothetical protein
VASWWSEKQFNQFLVSLPKKTAMYQKHHFFAQYFLGELAFAESISAQAKESACKKLSGPKVCSEANPEFVKLYNAARKKLESDMKQLPSLKSKAPASSDGENHAPQVAPTTKISAPNPYRVMAAIVGMSLVWKSFYKIKSKSSEAPVPMKSNKGQS